MILSWPVSLHGTPPWDFGNAVLVQVNAETDWEWETKFLNTQGKSNRLDLQDWDVEVGLKWLNTDSVIL